MTYGKIILMGLFHICGDMTITCMSPHLFESYNIKIVVSGNRWLRLEATRTT